MSQQVNFYSLVSVPTISFNDSKLTDVIRPGISLYSQIAQSLFQLSLSNGREFKVSEKQDREQATF